MQNNEDKYLRLKAIYPQEKLELLSKLNVAVIGLGGVGSYCACALVRSGVGNLTIVDFDKIEPSNINRQLFASEKTIGKLKVDVCENTLKEINSKINVNKFANKISDLNLSEVLGKAAYIIDAIDDVNDKIALAKFSQDNKIPIISCMGTAMKKDATKLRFDDIYNTSVCPLCKNFRKLAKQNNIQKLEVLYSTESPAKSLNGQLGSTSYLPPIAGMMLAGKVIESI